jgi:hypothetical protein
MRLYPPSHSLGKLSAGLIVALLALGLGLGPSLNLSAEAKKKAAAAVDPTAKNDAEVKKIVDPLNDQLGKLMLKVEARALLSPDEAGQLVDIKYKLVDAVTQYPQSTLLVRPLYQAGILFLQRESFNDAYELFSNLAQGFPTTPYGLKSKGQITQLEKRFGADYFAADVAAPPAGAPGATAVAGGTAVPPAKK